MTDQQIIDHILANPVADDHTDDNGDSGNGPGDNNDPGNDDGPGDDADHPGTGGATADAPPTSDGCGGYPSRRGGDSSDGHGDDDPDNDDQPAEPRGTSGIDTACDNSGRAEATALPAGSALASPWNVAELRVELATLLGFNQHPAELPGLGYIPAAVAQPIAARMASAQWRFVICAPDGVPICSGITSRRPASRRDARRDVKRGGILELHLTATQLDQLATAVASGQHSDWADVITDIANRYHRGIVDGRSAADAHSDADNSRAPNDTTPAPSDTARAPVDISRLLNDARRRFARAGLRRWVEARARYCQHPACRMPATQCDQDHRTDYADGGLTVDENLDPGCRHDHRLQHDGGWVVYRQRGSDPLTGPIIWVSPLGHEYESRPPPVMHTYPEPGHYYPGDDALPEWFTRIAERAKNAQRAARTAGATTAAGDEPTGQPRITTATYPERPPF